MKREDLELVDVDGKHWHQQAMLGGEVVGEFMYIESATDGEPPGWEFTYTGHDDHDVESDELYSTIEDAVAALVAVASDPTC